MNIVLKLYRQRRAYRGGYCGRILTCWFLCADGTHGVSSGTVPYEADKKVRCVEAYPLLRRFEPSVVKPN